MTSYSREYGWVPSLYAMQGIPYALVVFVAPVLYKTFNYSNVEIAFFTSLFTIPWFAKPLLAPLFEALTSKRNLTLITQCVMALLIVLLAISLFFNNFFYISTLLFILLAIASTVHDINSDGLYIVSLDYKAQAHFIGIRTLFYQIGKLLMQGILIFVVGYFIAEYAKKIVWQINFILVALTISGIAFYHSLTLPKDVCVKSVNKKTRVPFSAIITDLSHLPHLAAIIIFVLFYNFSEAALLKIVPLFLLDNITKGGLGLSVEMVGTIFGVIGTIGMLIGVIAAGLLGEKYDLKKCLTPITVFTVISNTGYLLLCLHPHVSFIMISLIIFMAEFAYGLSNGLYMLFLLKLFTKGTYPMSQYAIGTSLMSFGVTLSGAISGYFQNCLGYRDFFIAILAIGICVVGVAFYSSKRFC